MINKEDVLNFLETRSLRFNLIRWISRAIEVDKQRQQLARMDDADLRDIGITSAKRDQECARSFWDFD